MDQSTGEEAKELAVNFITEMLKKHNEEEAKDVFIALRTEMSALAQRWMDDTLTLDIGLILLEGMNEHLQEVGPSSTSSFKILRQVFIEEWKKIETKKTNS
jgi:hypothetical protein